LPPEGLIIVESPTKAKTLGKYIKSGKLEIGDNGDESGLPSTFLIIASGGHIIDLPKKKIGVNIEENFEPDYELLPGKSKIAKELKTAAVKAKFIYIATDPDREGEAIAWHLKNLIEGQGTAKIHRIAFHEITKSAVINALKSPGSIDMPKVDAQQARRVLDRLVGYQVSPLLWKTVTRGLSAGRVQSVALRLICEREVAIDDFVSEEYWSIDGEFKGEKVTKLTAALSKYDNKKIEISTQDQSDSIVKHLNSESYSITDIKRTSKKKNPSPPYSTSTLQQDAGRRLGFHVKRTMSIAQKLYEGINLGSLGSVGLITYMRTDSVRIANEAISNLRDWIADMHGTDYVNKTARVFKNKKSNAQDAHEAIRPTDIKLHPNDIRAYLSVEEFKLYQLIWQRFAATQMSPAKINGTTVIIGNGNGIDFRVSGQVIAFDGYLKVMNYGKTDSVGSKDEAETNLPPGLEVGMEMNLTKLLPKQHFTQPPPRFTEASLVKELDELGIGRPSTYATIISTLIDRTYVERKDKTLPPTDLGITVSSVLVDRFPDVFSVDFTARMEGELDKIETGINWQSVVREFYTPFSKALEIAEEQRFDVKKRLVAKSVGRDCPDCGKDLIYRFSRRGKFISCSGYPTCKFAESIEPEELITVDEKCPKCGSEMVVRFGKFGRFLGCSKYPKCRGIMAITTGKKCIKKDCEGELAERRTKRGKVFFGCNKYPKCDFVTWDEPLDGPCPECKAPTLFIKRSKKSGNKTYCGACDWSKIEEV